MTLALLLPAAEGVAQRGGQHLNSVGYQRALMESRKPKLQPMSPVAPPKKKKRARRAPVG